MSRADFVSVRYITEDLLKKLVGTISLEHVISLNLTLVKPGGKFKYIENLEKLKRIQKLNLNNNIIEKIEHISHMICLRELNLSDNCLTKIENLENLINLQILDLSYNKIKHIPKWLPVRLIQLRSFNVANNKINDMTEFVKFRHAVHLINLNVEGNPFTDISTSRLFLLNHLRTLQVLDAAEVREEERSMAQQRFGQEEVDRLSSLVTTKEIECLQLSESQKFAKKEAEFKAKEQKQLEAKLKDMEKKMKDSGKELETKNELLKKKTRELTNACRKQYELEQELAFYKIDHKFDSLAKQHNGLGTPDSVTSAEGSSVVDESPYLGKALFKPNKFAHEKHLSIKKIKKPQYGSLNTMFQAESFQMFVPKKSTSYASGLDNEFALFGRISGRQDITNNNIDNNNDDDDDDGYDKNDDGFNGTIDGKIYKGGRGGELRSQVGRKVRRSSYDCRVQRPRYNFKDFHGQQNDDSDYDDVYDDVDFKGDNKSKKGDWLSRSHVGFTSKSFDRGAVVKQIDDTLDAAKHESLIGTRLMDKPERSDDLLMLDSHVVYRDFQSTNRQKVLERSASLTNVLMAGGGKCGGSIDDAVQLRVNNRNTRHNRDTNSKRPSTISSKQIKNVIKDCDSNANHDEKGDGDDNIINDYEIQIGDMDAINVPAYPQPHCSQLHRQPENIANLIASHQNYHNNQCHNSQDNNHHQHINDTNNNVGAVIENYDDYNNAESNHLIYGTIENYDVKSHETDHYNFNPMTFNYAGHEIKDEVDVVDKKIEILNNELAFKQVGKDSGRCNDSIERKSSNKECERGVDADDYCSMDEYMDVNNVSGHLDEKFLMPTLNLETDKFNGKFGIVDNVVDNNDKNDEEDDDDVGGNEDVDYEKYDEDVDDNNGYHTPTACDDQQRTENDLVKECNVDHEIETQHKHPRHTTSNEFIQESFENKSINFKKENMSHSNLKKDDVGQSDKKKDRTNIGKNLLTIHNVNHQPPIFQNIQTTSSPTILKHENVEKDNFNWDHIPSNSNGLMDELRRKVVEQERRLREVSSRMHAHTHAHTHTLAHHAMVEDQKLHFMEHLTELQEANSKLKTEIKSLLKVKKEREPLDTSYKTRLHYFFKSLKNNSIHVQDHGSIQDGSEVPTPHDNHVTTTYKNNPNKNNSVKNDDNDINNKYHYNNKSYDPQHKLQQYKQRRNDDDHISNKCVDPIGDDDDVEALFNNLDDSLREEIEKLNESLRKARMEREKHVTQAKQTTQSHPHIKIIDTLDVDHNGNNKKHIDVKHKPLFDGEDENLNAYILDEDENDLLEELKRRVGEVERLLLNSNEDGLKKLKELKTITKLLGKILKINDDKKPMSAYLKQSESNGHEPTNYADQFRRGLLILKDIVRQINQITSLIGRYNATKNKEEKEFEFLKKLLNKLDQHDFMIEELKKSFLQSTDFNGQIPDDELIFISKESTPLMEEDVLSNNQPTNNQPTHNILTINKPINSHMSRNLQQPDSTHQAKHNRLQDSYKFHQPSVLSKNFADTNPLFDNLENKLNDVIHLNQSQDSQRQFKLHRKDKFIEMESFGGLETEDVKQSNYLRPSQHLFNNYEQHHHHQQQQHHHNHQQQPPQQHYQDQLEQQQQHQQPQYINYLKQHIHPSPQTYTHHIPINEQPLKTENHFPTPYHVAQFIQRQPKHYDHYIKDYGTSNDGDGMNYSHALHNEGIHAEDENRSMVEGGGLFCNVPQHCLLEKNISNLKEQIKQMKIQLKKKEKIIASDIGQKIENDVDDIDDYFRDHIQSVHARKLAEWKSKLKTRMSGLDSLDLAINQFEKLEEMMMKREEIIQNDIDQILKRQQGFNWSANLNRKNINDNSLNNNLNAYLSNEMEWIQRLKHMLNEDLLTVEKKLLQKKQDLLSVEQDLSTKEKRIRKLNGKIQSSKDECKTNLKEVEMLKKRCEVLQYEINDNNKTLETQAKQINELKMEESSLEKMKQEIENIIRTRDVQFKEQEIKMDFYHKHLEGMQNILNVSSLVPHDRLKQAEQIYDDELIHKQEHLSELLSLVEIQQSNLDDINIKMSKTAEDNKLIIQNFEDELSKLNEEKYHLIDEIKEKKEVIHQILNHLFEKENVFKCQEIEIKMKEEMLVEKERRNEWLEQEMKFKSDKILKFDDIINEKKRTVDVITDNINTLKIVITDLNEANMQKKEDSKKLMEDIVEQQKTLQKVTLEVQFGEDEINKLKDFKKEVEEEIEKLMLNKTSMKQELNNLQETHDQLLKSKENMEMNVYKLDDVLRVMYEEMSRMEGVIKEQQQSHTQLQDQIIAINKIIQDSRVELVNVDADVKESRRKLHILQQNLETTEKKKFECEEGLKEALVQLDAVIKKFEDKSSELTNLDKTLFNKMEEIGSLELKLKKFKEEAELCAINDDNFRRMKIKIESLEREALEHETTMKEIAVEMVDEKKKREDEHKSLVAIIENLDMQQKQLTDELMHHKFLLNEKTKAVVKLKLKYKRDVAHVEKLISRHRDNCLKLTDDLCVARAQNIELQQRMESMEKLNERETAFISVMTDFKEDLKHEVKENIYGINKAHLRASFIENEKIQRQQENIKDEIQSIQQSVEWMTKEKLNSKVMQSTAKSSSTITDKNVFSCSHQEMLKNKLQSRLEEHITNMQIQHIKSQQSIVEFKEKLNSLEKIISEDC